MKKRNKALLVLLALVLVTGLGAKMYSNVTMGDDEWVGLGASAGRIVFDDQTTDEVSVMDARFGVGIYDPGYPMVVSGHPSTAFQIKSTSTAGSSAIYFGDPSAGATGRVVYQHNGNYMTLHTGGGVEQVRIDSQGNVGVKDPTPSYDLDVAGDIRATNDVLANETVFIGSAEDADEDGDKMFTRADSADGGYAFWARKNLSGWPAATVFQDAAMGGDTGPDLVLWVQWIVHDNTTGDLTESDTFLYDGGGTTGQAVIGGSGDNTITLSFGRPLVGSSKAAVMLYEQGSHTFDVALLMMWVED